MNLSAAILLIICQILPSHGNPISSRIVNGEEASDAQFPFYALLYIQKSAALYQCGGSLIHPSFVLTAKHCLNGAMGIEVRLGLIDRNKPAQILMGVSMNAVTNVDIALIKLNQPAILNEFVNVISLPTKSFMNSEFPDADVKIKAIGLGLDETGKLPDRLKFVEMNILSKLECSQFYQDLDSHILCAVGFGGSNEDFGNTCGGDSGGPLLTNSGGSREIIGVNSFGSDLGCTVGLPSGFVNIDDFLGWIENVVSQI